VGRLDFPHNCSRICGNPRVTHGLAILKENPTEKTKNGLGGKQGNSARKLLWRSRFPERDPLKKLFPAIVGGAALLKNPERLRDSLFCRGETLAKFHFFGLALSQRVVGLGRWRRGGIGRFWKKQVVWGEKFFRVFQSGKNGFRFPPGAIQILIIRLLTGASPGKVPRVGCQVRTKRTPKCQPRDFLSCLNFRFREGPFLRSPIVKNEKPGDRRPIFHATETGADGLFAQKAVSSKTALESRGAGPPMIGELRLGPKTAEPIWGFLLVKRVERKNPNQGGP